MSGLSQHRTKITLVDGKTTLNLNQVRRSRNGEPEESLSSTSPGICTPLGRAIDFHNVQAKLKELLRDGAGNCPPHPSPSPPTGTSEFHKNQNIFSFKFRFQPTLIEAKPNDKTLLAIRVCF